MEHIGIDLGSKESQVCVRNGVGEIVEEKRCRTDQLGRYLGKRAPGRVVLETCTEAFRIAGGARQQGHDVRVVAATLVRSLGVGQRGLKNDRRDARALSEASCRMELPSVHIPSVVSQEVKAICVSREALRRSHDPRDGTRRFLSRHAEDGASDDRDRRLRHPRGLDAGAGRCRAPRGPVREGGEAVGSGLWEGQAATVGCPPPTSQNGISSSVMGPTGGSSALLAGCAASPRSMLPRPPPPSRVMRSALTSVVYRL